MNKSTIKKTLQKRAGGAEFITQNGVRQAMGWGKDRTRNILRGLDFIPSGTSKQYLIDEVAAKIFAEVERSWQQ